MVKLYKYSGAGNTFVVIDGRSEDVSAFREPARIKALCNRSSGFVSESETLSGKTVYGPGSDGLMILSDDPEYDFRMEFYNPDGSGGMMCGNGGRCIVAFADALGIRPSGSGDEYRFAAPDGMHSARILQGGSRKIVKLKMTDVADYHPVLDGWFVDTGTRHFVRFVEDAEAVNVEEEGRKARWDAAFAPLGANVNFVSLRQDGTLLVRTFEKGVEAETLACGTGITASVIAAYISGFAPATSPGRYDIRARIDNLSVDFRFEGGIFTDVYLTGPAEEI